MYFRYDSNDELAGVSINGVEYIYLKNLQGDVISILDTNGQSVVDYTYDAWGKVTSITGSMADSVGSLNPCAIVHIIMTMKVDITISSQDIMTAIHAGF